MTDVLTIVLTVVVVRVLLEVGRTERVREWLATRWWRLCGCTLHDWREQRGLRRKADR